MSFPFPIKDLELILVVFLIIILTRNELSLLATDDQPVKLGGAVGLHDKMVTLDRDVNLTYLFFSRSEACSRKSEAS